MSGTNNRSLRTEAELQLRQITGRDLQLWSMGLLVIAVLAIGVICLIVPNVMWNSAELRLDGRFLPQLFSGFIALVFLFNLYAFQQKNRLDRMRAAVIETMLAEAAQRAETNPAEDLMGPAYLTQVIDREIKRAERSSGNLSFAVVRVAGLEDVAEKYGAMAREHLQATAANLLKDNFRGSDTVCRSRQDEFLVVLPETNTAQAEIPFVRLKATIEQWNRSSKQEYELELQVGVAGWRLGVSTGSILEEARQAAEQNRRKHKRGWSAVGTLFVARQKESDHQTIAAVVPTKCSTGNLSASV